MFMNSVQNSDSKQCTESRLGWVHRVHTLNLGCAPIARWAGRVVAHRGCIMAPLSAVSRLCPAISWPCHRAHVRAGTPCRSSLRSRYKKLYRDPSPCRSPCSARCCVCRSAPMLCHRALGTVSQPLARCVATPCLPLLPRYTRLYL